MNKQSQHPIIGTIIYGLLVIVPLAVVFLLLVKLTEILEKIAAPLGLESALGAALALVLVALAALLVVLLLSFIVGSLMRRAVSYETVEKKILNQIPGYTIVANIAKGFSDKSVAYPAAMIELHGPGTAVFGFVMEEHVSGLVTVFVPSTPVLTVGNVHLVERKRITILEAGASDVANCISQWGIGSAKIVAGSAPTRSTKTE